MCSEKVQSGDVMLQNTTTRWQHKQDFEITQ